MKKSKSQTWWDNYKKKHNTAYQACKQKFADMEHGLYKSANIVKCTKDKVRKRKKRG